MSSQHLRSRAARDGQKILELNVTTVALSSGTIAYVDEGSGPPILLLHGAPMTSLGFVRVICELKANHRVIAPDLPGFGGSSVRPGFPATLASYAAFVEEFCRAIGLASFVMYVNDASGCFGLAAAAEMSEEVRGIVVASTVPIPLTGLAWPVKLALKYVVSSRLIRFLNRRLNLFAWMVATVAPWWRPFSAAERAVLVSQFDTPDKRNRIIDVFAAMSRDDEFMRTAAERSHRKLASKPVLLLYGQFDPMRFVGAIARFRRMFRDTAVRIVPFEEHFPMLASGTRVAKLVHQWATELRP